MWHILHRHGITCCGRNDLVCGVFLYFVTFPYGVSGQLWYLIVSISGFHPLLYYIKQIFLSETTLPSTLIFGIVIPVAITAIYIIKTRRVGFRLHTSTCVFPSINILAVII